MSLPVNELFRTLLESNIKTPQLILEIDGLTTFSSIPVQRFAEYGDDIRYGDENLIYGGLIEATEIKPWIDLTRSTQNITQQLMSDKGGFSSITNFDVAVIDKGGAVTEMISPSNTYDVLGQKAKLYLSLEGAAHPQDSILFFSGIVSGTPSGAGFIKFNLSSPEKLKNLEVFPKVSTDLTASLSNSATTVTVNDTTDFMIPVDCLRTYIIIDDEIIEYTGKTSTTLTGLTRGCFDTIAVSHDIGASAESAYRLVGNLRDLSLKIMLSGINDYFLTTDVLATNSYGGILAANAVFVDIYGLSDIYGLVQGDLILITGGLNAGSHTVNSVVQTDAGSYVFLNSTLITEGVGATISFKSKYAVLPKFAGLEMTPDQVDVQEFEAKYDQFSATFFEYDFFIKDSVKGSEFINEQILYPSGCYAIPRKCKTSLGLNIPPLAQYEAKVIDWSNVTDARGIVIDRSINNNFYNAVVYKYDLDYIDDVYRRGKIRQSSDSTNRIKIGNKPLTIAADGIRFDSNFDGKFDVQGRRYLNRYQFGAQSLEVSVNFGTGFTIEIGDSVIFSGADLKVSDINFSTRDFRPRLFEVVNKSYSITGKPIKLKLLDTAFNLNGRFGVIAPSSILDSGSTTTNLRLTRSYGTLLKFNSEQFKWRSLIGLKIRVHSKDYSYDEESTILALDTTRDALIIEALPSAPLEGYVVDLIQYQTTGQDLAKAIYCYFNNVITVTSAASQTVFNVSDASKIKVGYIVLVHSKDYANKSREAFVTNVTGSTVTVDVALGYLPISTDRVDLLGFVDGGRPYRIL
jgi:hypothetical protein